MDNLKAQYPLLNSIYVSDFKVPSYMKVAYYGDDKALITSNELNKRSNEEN